MDYELLIPDYLNDALDENVRVEFELALSSNPELQAKVAQEREWLGAMRSAQSESSTEQNVHLDFEPVRAKLQQKPFSLLPTFNPAWGYALASVFVVAIGYFAIGISTEPEYRTLTEPAPVVTVDIVRIVVTDYAAIQSIVSQYNLSLIQQYPAALTIDVDASALSSETIATMKGDGRIKLLQHIESGNAQ